MPELPELEVIKNILTKDITGKEIGCPVFTKPYILKGFFNGYEKFFPSRIEKIERKGKYLLLRLTSKAIIVIHLMKSGRIKIANEKIKRDKFTACYALLNDGGRIEVVEYGKEKMAKIYIVQNPLSVPGLLNLGIEPFSSSFTESYLKARLLKKRKQLKIFLKDQSRIAGLGNAYANEILWDAQLSPFKSSDSLTARDVKKLFSSIRKVLRNGIKEIEKRVGGKLFIKEPRDFMKVHNKKGAPCPGCENKIEWVYSKKNTTYYCSHCQTRGKIYKDRRLSKFLK